jgi:hypothetical protein
MRNPLIICILTTLFIATPALAGKTMRCGTHVISENDHVMRLHEHCGEPTMKTETQWIYDRGQHDFVTIVTIRPNDLTISRIEQQPRN